MHVTSVADSLLNEIMHTRKKKKEGPGFQEVKHVVRQVQGGFNYTFHYLVHLHFNLVSSRPALFTGGSNDHSNDWFRCHYVVPKNR